MALFRLKKKHNRRYLSICCIEMMKILSFWSCTAEGQEAIVTMEI